MSYDGTVWSESTPTNETLAHEIDDIARDIKIGVRSRLAIEHVWPDSQEATSSAGYHVCVSLKGQTDSPSLPVVAGTTQHGIVYADTAGAPMYRNADGVQHIGLLQKIYPIGGIYISTLDTNPNTLLGFGTWEEFGEGRVLVGVDAADEDFDASEKTGGAKTEDSGHTHTVSGSTTARNSTAQATGIGWHHETGTQNYSHNLTGEAASGGSATLSILQPYITVYMWKRTA